MEQHIPSLKTCQRLKDAGFPQETEFRYYEEEDIWGKYSWVVSNLVSHQPENPAAPILTEIREEVRKLPNYPAKFSIDWLSEIWSSDNPAEAAALLFLSLKEQGGQ